MAEEKKVTLEDAVEVLAKHASAPSDPDDAATLTRFNQQVADEKATTTEKQATPKGRP
jgi:hypothetical protein